MALIVTLEEVHRFTGQVGQHGGMQVSVNNSDLDQVWNHFILDSLTQAR